MLQGRYSVVSAAAAVEAGTHKHVAVTQADVVSVPALCAAAQHDVGPALWTSGSDAPLHCGTSHTHDPTQTYTP